MNYVEKKLRLYTYNVLCDSILLVVLPPVMLFLVVWVENPWWLILLWPPLMFSYSIIIDRRRYNERERKKYARISGY